MSHNLGFNKPPIESQSSIPSKSCQDDDDDILKAFCHVTFNIRYMYMQSALESFHVIYILKIFKI